MLDLEPFLLLPLALVLLLMAMPVVSRRIWGPATYVPPRDVFTKIEAGDEVAVLDIRSKKAFDEASIPGSINVPPGDVETYVAEQIPSETPVALVCQSDLKATKHAARLRKKGFANVAALKGGMFGWKRSKLPVHRAS